MDKTYKVDYKKFFDNTRKEYMDTRINEFNAGYNETFAEYFRQEMVKIIAIAEGKYSVEVTE